MMVTVIDLRIISRAAVGCKAPRAEPRGGLLAALAAWAQGSARPAAMSAAELRRPHLWLGTGGGAAAKLAGYKEAAQAAEGRRRAHAEAAAPQAGLD